MVRIKDDGPYPRYAKMCITILTKLTLVPGNNTIPMRSQVNQTLVLTQILENFKDGMLPIDIVGNSSC